MAIKCGRPGLADILDARELVGTRPVVRARQPAPRRRARSFVAPRSGGFFGPGLGELVMVIEGMRDDE